MELNVFSLASKCRSTTLIDNKHPHKNSGKCCGCERESFILILSYFLYYRKRQRQKSLKYINATRLIVSGRHNTSRCHLHFWLQQNKSCRFQECWHKDKRSDKVGHRTTGDVISRKWSRVERAHRQANPGGKSFTVHQKHSCPNTNPKAHTQRKPECTRKRAGCHHK